MKSILFLIVIVSLAFADETGPTLQKIREGVVAGKEIFDVIQAKSSSNSFHKISKITGNISKFFGAINPVFSLVSMFFPSSEINYLKSEFRQINSKLDHVFYELGEIKYLIEESSLKNQYASHEQTILSLTTKLDEYLQANASSAHIFKKIFEREFENSFNGAAQKFLNGMMDNNEIFSRNIPFTAKQITGNHRRRIQNIMKGTLNLIIQGVKVKLAYHKAKNFSDYQCHVLADMWIRKISSLISHMIKKDIEYKNLWQNQISRDLHNKLLEHSGTSNEVFSDKLWYFLAEKYDWRDWFVAAYNDIRGGDKHWVKACGGDIIFRQNKRNLVVASVDENKKPESADDTKSMLQSTKTNERRRGWWMNLDHIKYYDAKHIFDYEFDSKLTEGCTYASAGVVKRYNDFHAVATENRAEYVIGSDVILFAFS